MARLVEGHFDALAILAELRSRVVPAPPALLGVWAARPGEMTATPTAHGGWRLDGSKPFCSGTGHLDAALVAAMSPDGPRLFLVPAATRGMEADLAHPSEWSPLGMAPTASGTVRFAGVELGPDAAVGGPGAYVERPGFAHGGCGVAACWWGGAAGLFDNVRTAVEKKPHDVALADLGRAGAALHAAWSSLVVAASDLDADPDDCAAASRRALVVRLVVAATCRVVIDCAARHLGTSALAVDGSPSRRLADLTMYLTQFREESATELGDALLDRQTWGWG